MAKFPTIEEFVQQVKERVFAECLIDGEPLGELIDSGDLVHVCRCKDCKHWYEKYRHGVDMSACKRAIGYFGANDYCSRSERKEE